MNSKPFTLIEIRSQIGEGGMGAVYLARDTQLNRDLTLKVLPPPLLIEETSMMKQVRKKSVFNLASQLLQSTI